MTLIDRSRIFSSLVGSFLFAAVGCGAQAPDTTPEVTAPAAVVQSAKVSAKRAAPRCDIAVRCELGYIAVDTDGDGCNDACEPKVCDVAVRCELGYVAVDTDGDGCNDACEPE